MRPIPALVRSALVSIALTLLLPQLASAGELKTTIQSVSATCVGQELSVIAIIQNINSSFSVNDVVTTTKVMQGSTVLATKTSSPFTLAPSSGKTTAIATGWIPTSTGAYTVEVSADGTDDINGPQVATSPFTVCAGSTCPERPSASGDVIYLGTGSTGSITYTAQPAPCCYQIKVTVVTGRDAIADWSPQSWTPVGTSAAVSVTVNRAKMNAAGYMVLRVDWRKCDKSSQGSDYVLVRDGTQSTAGGPTTQPTGTTTGQTPMSGSTGDPVVTATREFVMPVDAIDASVLAERPVSMVRSYLSLLDKAVVKDHDFGPGWSHPFDWRAVVGDGEAYVVGPAGFTARFRGSGTTWTLDWPRDGGYSFAAPNATSFAFGDAGASQIVKFDTNGRLTHIGNSFGYYNTVNYNGRWVSSVTTPSGKGLRFTRDTTGLITRLTNDVTTVSYGYTGGILTSFTDGNGNRTTYNYVAGTNHLTSWVTAEGRTPLTNTYDANGCVTKQDMGDGFAIDFSFQGNMTTMAYPGGASSSHVHDANNRLTEATNLGGVASTFTYDVNGNRNSVKDYEGGTTNRTYANGLLASITLADGAAWTINRGTRTVEGVTMRDVEGIQLTGSPEYVIDRNLDGTPKSTKAPNGFEARYEYTSGGHLPTHAFDFYSDSRYTYTADGLVATRAGSSGTIRTYLRDAANQITEVQTGANTSTTFTRDGNGDVLSILNGTSLEKMTYDKDRQPASYTDTENRTWSRKFDSRGRIIELNNPTSFGARYSWMGPIMTGVEFGNGIKYTFTPSMSGLPGSITNGVGDTWGIDYDNEGRPKKFTFPDGLSNTYTTDANGRTTGISSPMGRTESFEYDWLGLMKQQTFTDGTSTSSQRSGSLETGTVSSGSASNSYETAFAGTTDFRQRFTDANGKTWLKAINGATGDALYTSPTGKTTRVLCNGGRSVEEIEWSAGVKATYHYDGRQTTGVTLLGEDQTWRFNSTGQLTKQNGDSIERDAAGRPTKMNGVTAVRGASGRINEYRLGNELLAKYEYGASGYVIGVEDRFGSKTKINYDTRGRTIGYEYPAGFKLNYEWNSDDQIVKVSTSDGWSMTYARDGSGRVTSRTRTDDVPLISLQMPVDRPIRYDDDNRISGATYDPRGNYNSTPSGTIGYSYGAFGLKGLDLGGINWSVGQDAYGSTKSVIGAGITYNFDFNYLTTIPTPIRVDTDTQNITFITLPSGKVLYGTGSTGQIHYPIDDGEGNVVAHRDAAGVYYSSTLYSPYGQVVGSKGEQGALGYQGLNGWVSLGSGKIVLNGPNVYDPDFGRYQNGIGIVPGFPSDTDPRQDNLQLPLIRFYDDGTPLGPILGSGSSYFGDCNLNPEDLEPADDCETAPSVSDLYGAGFFYVPGTDVLLRVGGYVRDGSNDNTALDALKLGYNFDTYRLRLDRDLSVDDTPKAALDLGLQYGVQSGYRLGLDYGFGPTNAYDFVMEQQIRAMLGFYYHADLFEVFKNFMPDTGTLTTPTPSPTPDPVNDTPKKK